MNIAVIGGSGFIGSHVVDKLLIDGHDVTVFDIMKPLQPNVRHVYFDILDLQKVVIALTGEYDAIYLLAAMANVNDVYNNPVEAGNLNIIGVANVLEAIRKNKLGRLIFASTVWVYSLARERNVDENTLLDMTQVDHVYTGTKIAAELYIQSYSKLYGLEYTILRYGIPYGPRARAGTVLLNFTRNALNDKPMTIQGDGKAYRKFLYVEDLAAGNVAALNPKAKNQIINLEGMREVSIKEVAETVQSYVPNSEISFIDARPGDYEGKTVSNSKSKELMDWEPKVDFHEGAGKFIEWYKEAIHNK
ncbi:MAG: NAD-dependent epimerase/dehydratase family protein [Candidatus Heimdallarchaeota archaeon]|nr:NAD-dependent epimerase/dehydratase family protein [Candidatus Heimdallarchaeota archaeon]